MDYIELRNMKFQGIIGCLDFEKVKPQEFVVTVRMGFEKIYGCYTDDLSDTVSYADIYDLVKNVFDEGRFNLIEKTAQVIADKVFEFDGRISEVKVVVSKPEAPVDGVFETMMTEINRVR